MYRKVVAPMQTDVCKKETRMDGNGRNTKKKE